MSDGNPYDEFVCACEAPNCRKYVSGSDWTIPALWERYHGHFSPYLQRRIEQLRSIPVYQNAHAVQIQPAVNGNGTKVALSELG